MAFMVAQPVTFAFWSWALHVRQDGSVSLGRGGTGAGLLGLQHLMLTCRGELQG